MTQVDAEAFRMFVEGKNLKSHLVTACDPPLLRYTDETGQLIASIHFEYDAKHPTGHPDKKPDWKEYYIQEDTKA